MTLDEFFLQSYAWADLNAPLILLAAVLWPAVGSVLAYIGRGGTTDADGRFIASTVMSVAMLAALLEVGGLFIAQKVLGVDLLHANVMLLAAPILCLAGSIMGIRLVFPLSELGSVRMVVDLGWFLLSCLVVGWLFSRFRGWGVLFVGSFTQLIVVAVIGIFFMRRLYRRAFGLDHPSPSLRARLD